MKLLHCLLLACAISQSYCYWGDIWGSMLETSKNVIQGGVDLTKGVVDTGVGVIKDVAIGTKDVVSSIGQGLVNVGSNVVQTGLGVLGTGVDIFGNVIKGAVDFTGKVVGAAVDTSVNVMCVVLGKIVECHKAGVGTIAPLPFQCRGKSDIIFAIDASGSVGVTNFKKQLSFAANLAGSFLVDQDNAKFGLVVYSTGVQKWFDLKDYSNTTDVMKRIVDTPYSAGWTATDKALSSIMTNQMFSPINGGRTDAPNVVIVLTDGQSDNRAATAAVATRLRSTGTQIFSVGIGGSINQGELLSLASRPEFVFHAYDFDALGNVLYQLALRTCKATGSQAIPVMVEPDLPNVVKACRAVADIVLVIDSSGSIGPLNYRKVLQFTVDLANSFIVGPDDVQFGSVVYSNTTLKWFDLSDNPDIGSVRRALLSTPYLNSTTRTDLALDLVSTANMLESSVGGRSQARKIVILLTDGVSDRPARTIESARNLKNADIDLIAVGIGRAQIDELRAVATSHSDVLFANDFDALRNIKGQVAQRACEAAKKK